MTKHDLDKGVSSIDDMNTSTSTNTAESYNQDTSTVLTKGNVVLSVKEYDNIRNRIFKLEDKLKKSSNRSPVVSWLLWLTASLIGLLILIMILFIAFGSFFSFLIFKNTDFYETWSAHDNFGQVVIWFTVILFSGYLVFGKILLSFNKRLFNLERNKNNDID